MFDFIINRILTGGGGFTFTRPIYADLVVAPLDLITFCLLAYGLQTGRMYTDRAIYRAGWGIVAIGTLWQCAVSVCRVINYRMPDTIWSGWALQEIGLCLLAIHRFWMHRKAHAATSQTAPSLILPNGNVAPPDMTVAQLRQRWINQGYDPIK